MSQRATRDAHSGSPAVLFECVGCTAEPAGGTELHHSATDGSSLEPSRNPLPVRIASRLRRNARLLVSWFDADFYRRAYPDLRALSVIRALSHWIQAGVYEGRIPSREALTLRARRRGVHWQQHDIARYVVSVPELLDRGITTYEGALVHLMTDSDWLRHPTHVELPDEFLAALAGASGQSDLGLVPEADGWSYRRILSKITRHSPLAQLLERPPADRFVWETYRFFVGYPPTPQSMQMWLARIDSGVYCRAAVIAEISRASPIPRSDYARALTADDVAEASLERDIPALKEHSTAEMYSLMGSNVTSRTQWHTAFADSRRAPQHRTTALPRIPRISTSSEGPRASVLVSSYRSEKFLTAWVANLEAIHDFESFEFIIVAVDPSEQERATFDTLARRHGNITLEVRSQPFGIYEAWNLGIELARADFVTNMNVDDIRSPASLVKQADLLSKYEWVDVVYQDVLLSLSSDATWSQLESIDAVCRLPMTTPAILMSGVNPPHNGPMWRKSLHREIGAFDVSLRSAADFDFWVRCANHGKVFFNVEDSHVGYFENPEGVSTSTAGVGIREPRTVIGRYENVFMSGPAPRYLPERDLGDPAQLRVDRLTRGLCDAILKQRQV